MPRTENEDWLLYQTFDDGTQDSGFKAFRAGLDIMEKRFTSTNNARDATAEQTLCSTCYYMVVETSEVPPCRNCRTTRSLWRSAAAPVA
jgi:hypothetical protein